jgi:hypothetical protein
LLEWFQWVARRATLGKSREGAAPRKQNGRAEAPALPIARMRETRSTVLKAFIPPAETGRDANAEAGQRPNETGKRKTEEP